MIEIVSAENKRHFIDSLTAMFRMRYEVVVKEWHWWIPSQIPGYDLDQFDTAETTYIILKSNETGNVIGCCRLNEASKPNMLSELWENECDLQPLPRDKDIVESSRFILCREIRRNRREYLKALWTLSLATFTQCYTMKKRAMILYTTPSFFNAMKTVMKIEPLGVPKFNQENDMQYIPAIAYITPQAIRNARRNLMRLIPAGTSTPETLELITKVA